MHIGEGGAGWAVVSTSLITLELFYSTKRIQRVAVSPHWTTKVINRAINKTKTNIGEKKLQEMTETKSEKRKNKNTNQIYIINTETLNVEP